MINENIITKLLDGVKVEWKSLGEVAAIGTGNSNTNEQVENGKYPFYVRSKDIKRINSYTFDETAIVIPGEGGVGDIFHFVEGKYGLHQRAYRVCLENRNIMTKFVYHYMIANFKKFILQKAVSATVISIRKPMIESFLIPIIPLNVQAKIVRILDTFTELTTELNTELTTELNTRKKQYNYYRDQLLSFKEGEVEWKALGELGLLIRGNGMQKKDFIEAGFPCIHYGQIYTRYGLFADKTYTFVSAELANKLRVAHKNDLLIATTSENDEDVLKPVAWLGEKVAISGDMMLFRHKENVKYLAYYFQSTDFQQQKKKYISGTKVRRISKDNLAKLKVSIPPLAEQTRIVAILDKFDTLTHSITEGLPREIELRQKQYEYYRDLLLRFPKEEAAV